MGGGKGGGIDMPDLGPLMGIANQQKDIAGQVWNRSQPLANQVFGDLERLLSGEQGGVMRTAFAPARDALEMQFQNAARGITEASPGRGGQMSSQLGQLQTNRALGIGQLESDLLKNAFAMASGIATGAPTQAMQGLSGAGSMLGNAAQMGMQAQMANAQMASQEAMAKGQGMGQLGGIGLMTALMPGGWALPLLGLGGAAATPAAANPLGAMSALASPWGTFFET